MPRTIRLALASGLMLFATAANAATMTVMKSPSCGCCAKWVEHVRKAGFEVKPGITPIVPIMLYDERKAHDMARALLEKGIYVIGFSYPVVPKGQARIRVQLSAAHSFEDIDRCVAAFATVGA